MCVLRPGPARSRAVGLALIGITSSLDNRWASVSRRRSRWPGREIGEQATVHVDGQLVDGLRELGVQLELLLLLEKIVVGLLLLERALAVLADHHERRKEDGLQRD